MRGFFCQVFLESLLLGAYFLACCGYCTVHELLHTIPVHPVFSFLPASLHSAAAAAAAAAGGGGGGGGGEGRRRRRRRKEGPSSYLLLPSAPSPLQSPVQISSDPPLRSHIIPVAFASSFVPNFPHSLLPSLPRHQVRQ